MERGDRSNAPAIKDGKCAEGKASHTSNTSDRSSVEEGPGDAAVNRSDQRLRTPTPDVPRPRIGRVSPRQRLLASAGTNLLAPRAHLRPKPGPSSLRVNLGPFRLGPRAPVSPQVLVRVIRWLLAARSSIASGLDWPRLTTTPHVVCIGVESWTLPRRHSLNPPPSPRSSDCWGSSD